MPLSTVLFRLGRLERRGHAERVPNPDDGRSYLIRLTKKGEQLLGEGAPGLPRLRRGGGGAARAGAGRRPARWRSTSCAQAVVAELESRRG